MARNSRLTTRPAPARKVHYSGSENPQPAPATDQKRTAAGDLARHVSARSLAGELAHGLSDLG
jgi:hypothetical protein